MIIPRNLSTLFVLCFIVFASSIAFANESKVDIYGASEQISEEILHSFNCAIKQYASALKTAILNDDDQKLKEAKASHDKILIQIQEAGDFAFVHLATIFYADDIFTTIDVVEKEDSYRLNYFKKSPTSIVTGADELIAFWNEHENEIFYDFISGSHNRSESNHRLNDVFLSGGLKFNAHWFQNQLKTKASILSKILLQDKNPKKRAAAALLLSFVNDGFYSDALAEAIHDPDSTVRNNAMRALAVLCEEDTPKKIPIERIIEALTYPLTSDRNKALLVLTYLSSDKGYKEIITRKAGRILIDHLKLKQPNLHDAAYIILQNISSRDFDELDIDAWEKWLKSANAVIG